MVVCGCVGYFAAGQVKAGRTGAFDGPGDFARNNVFAGLSALAAVPAWIACGSDDPFAPVAARLRARLAGFTGHPVAGGILPGCHDEAFWARNNPQGLGFVGRHLPTFPGSHPSPS